MTESIWWARSFLAAMFFFAASARTDVLLGQDVPSFPNDSSNRPPLPSLPPGFRGQALQNSSAPCLEPPKLPGLSDYTGPLKKTVGLFARMLERRSVQPAHYQIGVPLCSLSLAGKFGLFIDDVTDPVTFLSTGFNAAIDHASNRDARFGQGTLGYAKRFGVSLGDRVTSRFFKDFAYPTIFSEDPRYYRLGTGTARQRVVHAAEHLFIAHRTDGNRMFNYTQWLGTGTSVMLTNVYHPGNDRDPGAVAVQIGSRFAFDFAFDILREFWPEIACKLKLPFRAPPAPIGAQGCS